MTIVSVEEHPFRKFSKTRICSKKLRVRTAMLLVKALALNKCLLGEMKYICKMKG